MKLLGVSFFIFLYFDLPQIIPIFVFWHIEMQSKKINNKKIVLK
jgi:hypothetical protein